MLAKKLVKLASKVTYFSSRTGLLAYDTWPMRGCRYFPFVDISSSPRIFASEEFLGCGGTLYIQIRRSA